MRNVTKCINCDVTTEAKVAMNTPFHRKHVKFRNTCPLCECKVLLWINLMKHIKLDAYNVSRKIFVVGAHHVYSLTYSKQLMTASISPETYPGFCTKRKIPWVCFFVIWDPGGGFLAGETLPSLHLLSPFGDTYKT